MQRLVVSRPGNVRFVVEDDAGTLTAADAAPDVDVLDAAGTSVSAGTATAEVPGPGEYLYAWRPTALGAYRVEVAAAVGGEAYALTDSVRVVDRRCAPLSKLRRDAGLADASDRDFVDAVADAEDALERALRFSIVTTVDRVTVQVPAGTRKLHLPDPGPRMIQEIVAATRDGVTIDPATIRIEDDVLVLPTPASWDFLTGTSTGVFPPGEYVLTVKHGMTETPGDIQKAVRILARHMLVDTSDHYPDRASKIVSADTEIWFSRRTSDTWFGIPEVDDVVVAYREVPVMARRPLPF